MEPYIDFHVLVLNIFCNNYLLPRSPKSVTELELKKQLFLYPFSKLLFINCMQSYLSTWYSPCFCSLNSMFYCVIINIVSINTYNWLDSAYEGKYDFLWHFMTSLILHILNPHYPSHFCYIFLLNWLVSHIHYPFICRCMISLIPILCYGE